MAVVSHFHCTRGFSNFQWLEIRRGCKSEFGVEIQEHILFARPKNTSSRICTFNCIRTPNIIVGNGYNAESKSIGLIGLLGAWPSWLNWLLGCEAADKSSSPIDCFSFRDT